MRAVIYFLVATFLVFSLGCDNAAKSPADEVSKEVNISPWKLTVEDEGGSTLFPVRTITDVTSEGKINYKEKQLGENALMAAQSKSWESQLSKEDMALLDALVKEAGLGAQSDIGKDDPSCTQRSGVTINFSPATGEENSFYIGTGAWCSNEVPSKISDLLSTINLLIERYEKAAATGSELKIILRSILK